MAGNKTRGLESYSDGGVAGTAQTTRQCAKGQWRRGQQEEGETPGEEVEGATTWRAVGPGEPRGGKFLELTVNLLWQGAEGQGRDQKPDITFREMRFPWWVTVGQKVEKRGKAWG